MNTLWLTLVSLLAGSAGQVLPTSECAYRAERTATVPASGAELAEIIARAGSLRIEGRPGISEVRVRGTACTSDERYLDDIRLVTDRSGGRVRVEAVIPEMRGFGSFYSRLDLVIEVPSSLALDVTDSSGEAVIRNVAALDIEDSSGELDLSDIVGTLRIDDSSGGILVRQVRGNVSVEDTSGDIDLHDIEGSVSVESDSSGDIEATGVSLDVVVHRDSSGSIRVAAVKGDFVVERDGSGGINHRDVGGAVRIPTDRRSR